MARSFWMILVLLPMIQSCADIETETTGKATVSMRLEQDRSSHRSSFRGITPEEANTILVVLRPPSQCSPNYGNSTQDMDRALLNLSTQEVELIVPLGTQMKLCLYFFSGKYSLPGLSTGDFEAESFGESDVFTVEADTTSAIIDVVYWGTFYSTLTAKISSKSSAGLIIGTSGSFKLSDLTGIALKEDNFTIADNQSHIVTLEELAYGSYTYQVKMGGFSNEVNTFVVSSLEETLDIKLTPNPVDISWVSFENLSVAQIGTTDQADATGTLVVKVPLDQQDNVKQILSTMVVKNSTNSVTINVTPPTKLPTASSVDEEFVHYRIDFTANNVTMETGSNLFDVIITIGGQSKQVEMGSVSYDACVDANTMCLKLTWSDGSDPDLHSMYWPDWSYTEPLGAGLAFDDQNHVYGHPSYQKWLLTGDKVHLEDATTLPTLINASNQTSFTIDAGANTLVLPGSDLTDVTVSTPVLVSSDGTIPGGLDAGTIYYLHGIDDVNKTVQLATNSLNAMQGIAVIITDQGSGTHTLTALGAETQVWSTNDGKVGDGTYLVWVEDVSNADLQGVRVELSGPGLNPSITHGPFRFKDLDDGVTEAQNLTDPYQQHVFLIQVQNGSIVRSDKIPVGSTVDALRNGFNAEIGELPASLF
ncbi:MAG: hypothetical protein VX208_03455 [SAR324 cluster bacterium]|nr:hypothetical protein [SAR324 cluster bacterium]